MRSNKINCCKYKLADIKKYSVSNNAISQYKVCPKEIRSYVLT